MLLENNYTMLIILFIIAILQQFPNTNAIEAQLTNGTGLNLLILHNNDMHAHFEQIDVRSGICSPSEEKENKCYGGFARVSSLVKQYRNEAKKNGSAFLYLNAGDSYTGTPWFSTYGHQVVSDFMNILKPDAMVLGNHEFDNGLDGLIPFLNEAKFPVLTANIKNLANHPIWQTRALKKSIVLEVRGVPVGIIGCLTPDTKNTSTADDIEFKSEIETINSESEIMDKNGVKVIIALTHSGYTVDMEIAKNCPLVDVVVGGHSHSFLYSGNRTDAHVERLAGLYPTVITQASGKRVPVVQAYAFTKYMGELNLKFDVNGDLIQFAGRVILLDHHTSPDTEVTTLENIYRPKVQRIFNKVIGFSKVYLDRKICRLIECHMGHMITDAIMSARMKQQAGQFKANESVVLFAAGDIRASLKEGNITKLDLFTVLPYENQLLVVNITGKVLRDALEWGVHRYSDTKGRSEFLQMSGIRVSYNITKETGKRVESVSVLCSFCNTQMYNELDPIQEYSVIITSFLYGGGDGFDMFKGLKAHYMNVTVTQAVEAYIERTQIINPVLDDRIQIHK